MPLYEYQCEQCGQKFEVIQKFADEPVSTHEGCGGKVNRLLSAPALQFKGSGWYVNDYAKGSGSSSKSSGDKSHSDSGGSEKSSSDKSSSEKSGSEKSSTPAPAPASSSDTKSNT